MRSVTSTVIVEDPVASPRTTINTFYRSDDLLLLPLILIHWLPGILILPTTSKQAPYDSTDTFHISCSISPAGYHIAQGHHGESSPSFCSSTTTDSNRHGYRDSWVLGGSHCWTSHASQCHYSNRNSQPASAGQRSLPSPSEVVVEHSQGSLSNHSHHHQLAFPNSPLFLETDQSMGDHSHVTAWPWIILHHGQVEPILSIVDTRVRRPSFIVNHCPCHAAICFR